MCHWFWLVIVKARSVGSNQSESVLCQQSISKALEMGEKMGGFFREGVGRSVWGVFICYMGPGGAPFLVLPNQTAVFTFSAGALDFIGLNVAPVSHLTSDPFSSFPCLGLPYNPSQTSEFSLFSSFCLSLSFSFSVPGPPPLTFVSLSLSHLLFLSQTHTLSPSLTPLTDPHSLSHSLFLSQTLTLSRLIFLSQTHSLSHAHSHKYENRAKEHVSVVSVK